MVISVDGAGGGRQLSNTWVPFHTAAEDEPSQPVRLFRAGKHTNT